MEARNRTHEAAKEPGCLTLNVRVIILHGRVERKRGRGKQTRVVDEVPEQWDLSRHEARDDQRIPLKPVG